MFLSLLTCFNENCELVRNLHGGVVRMYVPMHIHKFSCKVDSTFPHVLTPDCLQFVHVA